MADYRAFINRMSDIGFYEGLLVKLRNKRSDVEYEYDKSVGDKRAALKKELDEVNKQINATMDSLEALRG